MSRVIEQNCRPTTKSYFDFRSQSFDPLSVS